jgi:SPP1 gp7 family putative phage head morphogenesis protein
MNDLFDLIQVRNLLLQRVAAGQVRDIDRLFQDIADQIERDLSGIKPLTTERKRSIDRIIADLQDRITIAAPDLTDLAETEAKALTAGMVAAGIDAGLPPLPVLQSIASNALIEGAVIGEWFSRLENQMRFDVGRTIRAGVATGRTNAQITRDIIGFKVDKHLGKEALKVARRDASAVVRTAVQTIANDASQAVFEENADVIQGLEYVATLDSRTTPQCAALDGGRWKLDGAPLPGTKLPFRKPPLHWQCRSRLVPITELSDAPGTRSSAIGPISSKIKFEQFMDKQGPAFAAEVLGRGRYEFYKANKLTLSQLIDPRSLEPLTLSELREKFG